MFPKVSRCPIDMLSQILYDKTKDGGKLSLLLIKDNMKKTRRKPELVAMKPTL
jgi:hypothetical protein